MPDPIDELLAEVESKPKPASESDEAKKAEAEAQAKKDEEVARKEEQLANLNKAIAEANEQLRTTRKAKPKPEVEELPKIDLEDPSAKSWDRHINEKVDPMRSELEKEKEEIRTFALQEFLKDKPSLAKNSDKVKELISTYDRIKTASERTKEGVLLDLNKAYGAVYHEQLIAAARKSRIEKAEQDSMLSDIAISRGATSYTEQKEREEQLSEADKKQLQKWGIDPSEWQKEKKQFS